MSTTVLQPDVRGKLKEQAPLAPLVWFKSGGKAEWLFEPADEADLVAFLKQLDPAVPVMALGLGSNMIVRDGGVPGVVVRLRKGCDSSRARAMASISAPMASDWPGAPRNTADTTTAPSGKSEWR